MCRDIVCGCVAAPPVAVQANYRSAGPVAVVAG